MRKVTLDMLHQDFKASSFKLISYPKAKCGKAKGSKGIIGIKTRHPQKVGGFSDHFYVFAALVPPEYSLLITHSQLVGAVLGCRSLQMS